MLVHGWPGSVWEFYKLIPLLTEHGFHVVAPSIPGYGFSEEPHKKGNQGTS
jgi:microsomal epoxide hydrolase